MGAPMLKLKSQSGTIHRIQRMQRSKHDYVPFCCGKDGTYWCWCGRKLNGELMPEDTPTTYKTCKNVETR